MLTLLENLMLKFNREVDHRIWALPVSPPEPQAPILVASWVSLWTCPTCTSKGHVLAEPTQQPAFLWAPWCYHPSYCSSRNFLPPHSVNPVLLIWLPKSLPNISLYPHSHNPCGDYPFFPHLGSCNSLPAGLSASILSPYSGIPQTAASAERHVAPVHSTVDETNLRTVTMWLVGPVIKGFLECHLSLARKDEWEGMATRQEMFPPKLCCFRSFL